MRGFRWVSIAALVVVGLVLAVGYVWALPSDNLPLREAMAKAGQNCGRLIEQTTENLPIIECSSAANDGYVVIFQSHDALIESMRFYCDDPEAQIDQNDWLTSAGYFIRSGSAIIKTLSKHLDYEFYSAQEFCFEL